MRMKSGKFVVVTIVMSMAISSWGMTAQAAEVVEYNNVIATTIEKTVSRTLQVVFSDDGEVWDVEAENERALELFKEYNEAIDAEDNAIAHLITTKRDEIVTEQWIASKQEDTSNEARHNNGIIQEFISVLNEERAALGLEALQMNGNLMRLAESRANAIESNFSHDGATTAECIAFGSTTGLGFVEQFKNSPGHWSILTSNYKAIGIGVRGSYMAVLVTTDEPDGYTMPEYDVTGSGSDYVYTGDDADELVAPPDYIDWGEEATGNSDYWTAIDTPDLYYSPDEIIEGGWD